MGEEEGDGVGRMASIDVSICVSVYASIDVEECVVSLGV